MPPFNALPPMILEPSTTSYILQAIILTIAGINFGVGYAFHGKDEGVTVDLMLLDWTECYKHAAGITETGVSLSIGYKFGMFAF